MSRWLHLALLVLFYVVAAIGLPLIVCQGCSHESLVLLWKISFACGAYPLLIIVMFDFVGAIKR